METSLKHYHRLSFAAVCILILLVSLQVVWVIKAVRFQEREIIHALKEVVGNVGLEINGIDHNAFHGDLSEMDQIPTSTFTEKVDTTLLANGISAKTYFAVFQDTLGGIFRSNGNAFKEELLASGVRICLTCIVSFSTVPKEDFADLNRESIPASTTFQYYSPVKGLKKESGQTLWVSLYQPATLSAAIQSLAWLFVINLVLLLALLALFRYLILSLSRHKQLAKVKNDFFNNMTHEFKTPISSIRLASRVLRKENDLTKRDSYYDLIEKESKSLEQQIDQLLELSLLENHEIELEKESVDMGNLIQAIPSRLKALLDNRSGRLYLDSTLEGCHITGDRTHLENSLCNLVENSLKYSPLGVEIWITASQKEGKLTISVRDNGPGIPAADQPNIFRRFYRGQAVKGYQGPGFGIGLSYVKSIVEAHNGVIGLNPNCQTGTEFIIEL